MASDRRREVQKRYDQKCKTYCIRLRKDKDADLIDWITRHGNLNGIVKSAIRTLVDEENNT